jgi:hypothetical protein
MVLSGVLFIGEISRKLPIFLIPRFIKRLFLTMLLLTVLFIGFLVKLVQAFIGWFVANILLVFLLFMFFVIIYCMKKVSVGT